MRGAEYLGPCERPERGAGKEVNAGTCAGEGSLKGGKPGEEPEG